jgi:hypothetical protein
MALRRGRQYLREMALDEGQPFALPRAGEIVGWSRIMCDCEVVVALNTHGLDSRRAYLNIDGTLNPAGKTLQILYRSDWSDDDLRSETAPDETVTVRELQGRSVVEITLPPAGMVILR